MCLSMCLFMCLSPDYFPFEGMFVCIPTSVPSVPFCSSVSPFPQIPLTPSRRRFLWGIKKHPARCHHDSVQDIGCWLYGIQPFYWILHTMLTVKTMRKICVAWDIWLRHIQYWNCIYTLWKLFLKLVRMGWNTRNDFNTQDFTRCSTKLHIFSISQPSTLSHKSHIYIAQSASPDLQTKWRWKPRSPLSWKPVGPPSRVVVTDSSYRPDHSRSLLAGRFRLSSAKKSRLRMTEIRMRRAVSMECFWNRR